MSLDPVDQANFSKTGWSQVFYYTSGERRFYVKKQTNYKTYRLGFPLSVPTFKAEFDNINRYKSLAVPSLKPVYFAWDKAGNDDRAILITEALEAYRPLDDWLNEAPPIKTRRRIYDCLGKAVSKLHAANIEHRHLYPKHIFLRQRRGKFDCRFIDLESSRSNFGLRRNKLRDLATLSRRTPQASRQDKLHFLAAYLAHPDTNVSLKQIQHRFATHSRKHQTSLSGILKAQLNTRWQTFKTEAAMMIYFSSVNRS